MKNDQCRRAQHSPVLCYNVSVKRNEIIIEYCNSDPAIELQDVFKFLYQSCFGCEHLVKNSPMIAERIREEMQKADEDDLPDVEMLEGDYCRVHLKVMKKSGVMLTPEMLAILFAKSAKKEPEGDKRLKEKLDDLMTFAREGLIPFSETEVDGAIAKWRANDFCPVHHSENFRNTHHPAYRVISSTLAEGMNLL